MMRERVGDMPQGSHAGRDYLPVAREAGAAALAPGAKRVVFVGPSASGLIASAGMVIRELGLQGDAVHCFAAQLDNRSKRVLNHLNAEVAELPEFNQGFSPIADQRTLLRLHNAFRNLRPDTVVGCSAKGAALAGMAARLTGVPHTVAIIGELGRGFVEAPEKPSATTRSLQKSLLRLAFRVSDTAVFLNEENHKLLARYKLLPARMRQFPLNGSGIDIRLYPETELPPLEHGVVFLFAGPLDRRLGVQEYCEAARILKSRNGNFRCLLCGPEAGGAGAIQLGELKQYRDAVQYIGPHTDPRPYMSRAHAIVMPGRGDTIPRPLIEGLAMGRPIITSTARGCRVAVSEGQNGLLVPPGDPAALAGAMVRLLRRPDLIPSMSRASRELAAQQFDCRRINEQFLAALSL